MLPGEWVREFLSYWGKFQRAPTLGGECYSATPKSLPFGVSAKFQRAPTLGGECYKVLYCLEVSVTHKFQRAPTLGGECYR